MSALAMQPSELLSDAIEQQLPSGAFPSVVTVGERSYPDENAFVTALVLERLVGLRRDPGVAASIERGLDFLERCASTELPGAFHFHARGAALPVWLDAPLPPDADDTALVASVLLRFGRRDAEGIASAMDGVLEPHRVHWRPESAPPWVRLGATRTWLAAVRPNPVDACVNANVAALYALLGRGDHPIAQAAAHTATGAARWGGPSHQPASQIAPYYPDLGELVLALERGAASGVAGFADAASALASRLALGAFAGARGCAVCGSADGRWWWWSPVLHDIRRVVDAAGSDSTQKGRHV